MKYGAWKVSDFEVKRGTEIVDGDEWTFYHLYWKKTGERLPNRRFNSPELAIMWLKGFLKKANGLRKEAASKGIKTF